MIFKYVESIFDVFKLIWEQFKAQMNINGIFVNIMTFSMQLLC